MKLKYKNKYLILFILGVAIIILSAILAIGHNSYERKTAEVKIGTIKNTIEETGTVFSKRVNTFYSDLSQRVEVLNVSVGDRVKKGDIILTYENNYDLEIERANKQIEAITAIYNETVKEVDFQKISNMKLNISAIENNLSLAKSNFEKIKELYENDAISEVEYNEAENNVKVLEDQLQEAKNNYNLMTQGISANVKKQYEAQIEEIMVQIKILEKKVEQASIKAEFDGIITELNVNQGGMTKPGVPVVELQEENNLGIYVELLTEDAVNTIIGMPFIIDNNGEIVELKINRIYPKAESTVSELGVEQKRVRIEADLDKDMKMKIGSEVNVKIVLEEKDNVLLVDKNAIYEKDHKEFVTVIENGNKVEKEVITGLKNDKYVEIINGLKENDIVLIEQ